ncbi:50S ribosomal protein L10 [Patescibacteria group bacterium]|nr:50S ribosomal protein L10 [Patescibacteria group bacterium]MBU4082672.1 50S ribosomal protein L10 [Patescibacteria group bacterium]
MITKEKKKEIVDGLTDKLSRQTAVVFFDYTGLKVNQVQKLREKLRGEEIDCQASKKTLIDLALGKAGLSGVKIKDLPGQVAMVLGYKDEVAPAKILYDFSKGNENLKILSGFVQGEYLGNDAILSLAKLPSKQELLGKLVGSIASPLSGMVNVLQGNLRGLICVLKHKGLKA